MIGGEEAMGEERRPRGYRGPQVCKIVGISYRQLDHWDRTGLLQPSLAQARGSGTQRLYSYKDVVALRVIKQLLDSGVTLQRARRAIAYFRETVGDDLASANLVLGASDSVLARNGDELMDLLAGGQGVLNIVPLSGVVNDVTAGIRELGGADEEGTAQAAAGQSAGAGADEVAQAR